MSASDVRREIERFVDQLWSAELAADSNKQISDGRRVTWAGSDASSPLWATPSIAEYLRLLRERQYTVLLTDYSFLQLSFEFDGSRPVKTRQCFYPCPLAIDPAELEEFGLADYVDALNASSLVERVRLEAPVRFDFDSAAAKEDHPASHLTISRDCCRVPAFGPLSLGHFVRFVFRNFYPEWWREHEFLRTWTLAWGTRTLAEDDHFGIHVECKRDER